jgi:hypothetical protein
MSQSSSSSGIGFAGLLAIVFITLKLLDKIDWSWWWVLAPIWIPAIFIVGALFGQGKTLTKLEAMRKFGVGNLGGRVYDLKQARWPVTKDWKTLRNGKRVAEYRFEIKR